jgi:hypothetical protein
VVIADARGGLGVRQQALAHELLADTVAAILAGQEVRNAIPTSTTSEFSATGTTASQGS